MFVSYENLELQGGGAKQTDTIKKFYISHNRNENGLIFCRFIEYSRPILLVVEQGC